LQKFIIKQRPPTIVLYFSRATVSELMTMLDEVAEPCHVMNSVQWYFPRNEDWRVLVYFDPGIVEEYTENERELVYAEVGRAPSAVLTLILNTRFHDEPGKAAKMLAQHLLGMFYGIADDRSGDESIWNLEEIRNSKHGVEFPGNVAPKTLRRSGT
jgi:hypothetical protein